MQLLEENGTPLVGDDAECTVIIHDKDQPGRIGFEETAIDVRRKDKMCIITLVRKNGSDGEISCTVNTISDVEGVPGKVAAVEGKDFVPIRQKEVTFRAGQVEFNLEIEMPDCTEVEVAEGESEEPDTVSF